MPIPVFSVWTAICMLGAVGGAFLIISPDLITNVNATIVSEIRDNSTAATELSDHNPDAVVAKMEAAFGKPFYELTDAKDTGKEVLSLDPQQTKDSYVANGAMIGLGNVTEYGTYVSTYSSPSISSTGKGMIVQNDKVATFTATDTGKYDKAGNLFLKGSMFFESSSKGMEKIDGKVGLYLYWKGSNGTDWTKTWLWD